MRPAIGLTAKTLTPFSYHSLAVQGGTATLPELIGDNALAFGLASALGYARTRAALPQKDYRRDLRALPWRTSVLITDEPRLLPPLARRLNLEEEGGYQKKLRDVAYKGNMKQYWTTQEVPAGVVFRGAIFGFDPFAETRQEAIMIRIGLHRNGMLRLTPNPTIDKVRLNATTATLFGRELRVERFLLYGLQLTPAMSLAEAGNEVAKWR